MTTMRYFRIKYHFFGICQLCRKIPLTTEMYTQRLTGNIIHNQYQLAFYRLQSWFYRLAQYRKNLFLDNLFLQLIRLLFKILINRKSLSTEGFHGFI